MKRGRPKKRKKPVRRTGLPRSAAGKRSARSCAKRSKPREDCVSDGKYYFNEILDADFLRELTED